MVHVLQCVSNLQFLQCVLSVLFLFFYAFYRVLGGRVGVGGWSGLITFMRTCVKHLRACFFEVFVSKVSLWLLDAASLFGRFLMLACSSMDPINPFLKSGSGVIRLMFIFHITCWDTKDLESIAFSWRCKQTWTCQPWPCTCRCDSN